MVESREHIAFKKIAIDILKARDFSPNEIFEEYNVEWKVNGRIRYQVDVVGIRGNYKVAIECGSTPLSKLMDLRKIFNEVIVVDVEKVVEMYEYWRTKYFTETTRLRQEIEDLKEYAERVCEDANSRVGPLLEEIEKLKRQIENLKAKLRRYEKVMAQAWKAVKEPF